MPWQNLALGIAGLIGAAVAIFHGVLVQRLMVKPFAVIAFGERRFSPIVGRLVPMLLHFSTAVWFAGGAALIAATFLDADARLAICAMVGAAYLFGVVGNFWATRGRHPGWMLLAFALVLIAVGAVAPSWRV